MNTVSLRRYGVDRAQRNAIKRACLSLFSSSLKPADAPKLLRERQPTKALLELIDFVAQNRRELLSLR